jgi:recombination protein RecT
VSNLLQTYESTLKNALPTFLTPQRMIRVALTAMSKNPQLLDCTQPSLMGCILTAAQLGLLPDEVLGEAYLIPFKNTKKGTLECTFIVGYRGLCQLAMRSGQVKSVQARAVFAAGEPDGDQFVYEMGLDEKLHC